MQYIKSYTDINQSKKLAEILPVESADYCWGIDYESRYMDFNSFPYTEPYNEFNNNEDFIPCWSLAALLKIIGHYTLQTASKDKKVFIVSEENYPICSDNYSEPVDACYEMILKLKEKNLL